jgi:hypothetical protein
MLETTAVILKEATGGNRVGLVAIKAIQAAIPPSNNSTATNRMIRPDT